METNRESSVFGAKKQGCGAVVKMTQHRHRSFSFHEHSSGSSSGALAFDECAPAPFHFHGFGSSSGFCLFPNINILNALLCLKLKGKKFNQVHKIKRIYKRV